MPTPNEIFHIFGPDGVLARHLPHYQNRSGQLDMALAVARVLRAGGILAAEAGTGIGKTMAYLIPAVLSGQKVVVSTATINLQEQILHKEIPFIKQYVDPELTALCVKGRQNYICLARWKQALAASKLRLFDFGDGLIRIGEWLKTTETGDRVELPWIADDSLLWREICSSTEKCLGNLCPEGAACFISQLRRFAAGARIVIVNHHLFFSDLGLRRSGFAEVLPRYESVIFDEAHHLENVATQYFGIAVSLYQFLDLGRDIENTARLALKKKKQKKIIDQVRTLSTEIDHFGLLFPKEKGKFPLQPFIEKEPGWPQGLFDLQARLAGLIPALDRLTQQEELWASLFRRAEELQGKLFLITEQHDPAFIRWFERRERTVQLGSSPIDLADDIQKHLYSKICACILTSATLTVGTSFSYLQDRLGLPPEMEALILPSPFDYKGRTLLYVPDEGFPEPSRFLPALGEKIEELLLTSRGRALLLFTSVYAMHHVYGVLQGRIPYLLLMQGMAPKSLLLDTFQRERDSVLLAVASFWEGVDVPGEALTSVIIDKLPFEVPSDPVVMARMEKIKEEGGNPFFDFQVPRAIFALRQGIGRLMRVETDQGLLAIMDVRLYTKGYGRIFLESLPDSPITRDLADVRRFFAGL